MAVKREGGRVARYDHKTALIVVDVQNDFAHPKGNLYVSGGEEVVPLINEEITAAQAAGAPVFYTQDWHPDSTPHFEKDGGIWPVHCVRDTWGAQFHPDLKVAGDVVRKGTGGEDGYSGFTVRDPESGSESETGLDEMLRTRDVTDVVVAGLATDYCVKETVLDARRKGFGVTAPRDAMRAVNLKPGDGEQAIQEMERAGARLE
ncbi:MAG: isochorismatase family protein [Actinomycetota bacterium]